MLNRTVSLKNRVVPWWASALGMLLYAACGGGTGTGKLCQFRSDTSIPIQLVNCDSEYGGMFGAAVALSKDGRTAMVGAPIENKNNDPVTDRGAAIVFVRDDSGLWTQQQQLREIHSCAVTWTTTGYAAGECDESFGATVGLSSDGNTAVVGAVGLRLTPGFPPGGGPLALPFGRSADGVWTQQPRLYLSGSVPLTSEIGGSIALSADGSTILYTHLSSDRSFAQALALPGGSNMRKLQASDMNAKLWAVALSGDGNTALIGADGQTAKRGAAYAFVRDQAGEWTQQMLLGADDGAVGDHFGIAVALSEDGNTALVASQMAGTTGAAYVFARSADGSWSQKQKLLARSKIKGALSSTTVALSGDGKVALVATQIVNSSDGISSGVASLYVQSVTGTWTDGPELPVRPPRSGDWLGAALALSGDGHTILIGAPRTSGLTDLHLGAAYIFTID